MRKSLIQKDLCTVGMRTYGASQMTIYVPLDRTRLMGRSRWCGAVMLGSPP